MANFDIAFRRTISAEGGYVNDPDDKGGETYMGISRRAHPSSKIWTYIDKVEKKGKTNRQITAELKKNNWLTAEVKKIYKESYWDKFQLDKCRLQKISNEIFDDAVNRGVGAAAYIACIVLNIPAQKRVTQELLNKLKSL